MKKSIIFVLTLLCTGILFACGEKKIYNKWVEKDGNKYYYDKTGEMVKNKKCIIDGKSYYFLETGEMAKGIIQNGSRMQYYDESGCLVTNRIVKWNENSFLVDKDGNIVKNGWYKLSGDWYYVENNNLKSGWIEDSGSWYFLKTYSYSMCVNQWIGNDYYVGEDGKMLVNTTREIGGKKYIFDSSGKKTEIKLPQGQSPTKIQANGIELIIEKYPNPFWAEDTLIKIEDLKINLRYEYDKYWLDYDISFQVLDYIYRSSDNVCRMYYKIYDEDGYVIDTSWFSLGSNVFNDYKKNEKIRDNHKEQYKDLKLEKKVYKIVFESKKRK